MTLNFENDIKNILAHEGREQGINTIRQHALVARRNKCECGECFCCYCVEWLKRHEKEDKYL